MKIQIMHLGRSRLCGNPHHVEFTVVCPFMTFSMKLILQSNEDMSSKYTLLLYGHSYALHGGRALSRSSLDHLLCISWEFQSELIHLNHWMLIIRTKKIRFWKSKAIFYFKTRPNLKSSSFFNCPSHNRIITLSLICFGFKMVILYMKSSWFTLLYVISESSLWCIVTFSQTVNSWFSTPVDSRTVLIFWTSMPGGNSKSFKVYLE